ncbi:MAG: hypothetical protein HON47_01045 [Candidatus Diapherotrites archaeon]|jgi:hypothetical protein|uniref:Uncharacterized protein n=1 Tax=Candidatus Iainarchaeum sp. TaxID=3101447 RepID=A0A8T5GE05_9ARCH|nr:hypothetical protein [Candidatus Diapherotrites archaeon]
MESIVFYFSKFDMFAGGFIGFFSLFAFFYAFSFTGVRGEFEHPFEKALELLLPAFIVALFLNFLGLPQIVIGASVVVAYVAFAKNALKLNNKQWAILAVKIACLLAIFGLLDLWSRNILFIGYLAYNILVSEKKLKDKEKDSKNKENEKD